MCIKILKITNCIFPTETLRKNVKQYSVSKINYIQLKRFYTVLLSMTLHSNTVFIISKLVILMINKKKKKKNYVVEFPQFCIEDY